MEVLEVENPVVTVRVSQYPDDNKIEFLIIGKSNVGKSSFINTIVNRKSIAKTSSKPGKTQTLNFYLVNKDFYIVDVPGYGYAYISKKQQDKFGMMIEEYLKSRPNLKHVFLLIDYRHKPSENDLMMYDFLKYYNLPVTVVTTKYDKINKTARIKQDAIIKGALDIDLGDEIIPFSSITKVGKDRVYEIIESYLKK